MSGWNEYKKALREANNEYLEAAQKSWDQYVSELNAVLDNPKVEPYCGRVAVARAVARFYSRNEKTVMVIPAAEQVAFGGHIKPLVEAQKKAKKG